MDLALDLFWEDIHFMYDNDFKGKKKKLIWRIFFDGDIMEMAYWYRLDTQLIRRHTVQIYQAVYCLTYLYEYVHVI